MNKNSRIWVTGHLGLVGSALLRRLSYQGFTNVIVARRARVDLRSSAQTTEFVLKEAPEYIFLCAAKVGGIGAHMQYPGTFLVDNLAIQTNVMNAAYAGGVRKLLFFASACAYPKHAPNPLKEEYLLSGPLEPSNKGYAVAKIAGILACQAYREEHSKDFIACMPTNLYGPGDNYHPYNSHVIPGMIDKIHNAKVSGAEEVVLWGDGTPVREFLYSDDLADAAILLMQRYSCSELINLGSGEYLPLRRLAEKIASVIGFRGTICWNSSMPNGTPERWLDNSKLFSLGWKPTVKLDDGLKIAYHDFLCRKH